MNQVQIGCIPKCTVRCDTDCISGKWRVPRHNFVRARTEARRERSRRAERCSCTPFSFSLLPPHSLRAAAAAHRDGQKRLTLLKHRLHFFLTHQPGKGNQADPWPGHIQRYFSSTTSVFLIKKLANASLFHGLLLAKWTSLVLLVETE